MCPIWSNYLGMGQNSLDGFLYCVIKWTTYKMILPWHTALWQRLMSITVHRKKLCNHFDWWYRGPYAGVTACSGGTKGWNAGMVNVSQSHERFFRQFNGALGHLFLSASQGGHLPLVLLHACRLRRLDALRIVFVIITSMHPWFRICKSSIVISPSFSNLGAPLLCLCWCCYTSTSTIALIQYGIPSHYHSLCSMLRVVSIIVVSMVVIYRLSNRWGNYLGRSWHQSMQLEASGPPMKNAEYIVMMNNISYRVHHQDIFRTFHPWSHQSQLSTWRVSCSSMLWSLALMHTFWHLA